MISRRSLLRTFVAAGASLGLGGVQAARGEPGKRDVLTALGSRDSVEDCLATLRDAYLDRRLSCVEKSQVRKAIVRSEQGEWISSYLLREIEQALQPGGDPYRMEVVDAADMLGNLRIQDALEPMRKLFESLFDKPQEELDEFPMEWYCAVRSCGQAVARIGKQRALDWLAPARKFDGDLDHVMRVLFLELRHLAGDRTAFRESLDLAVKYPGQDYLGVAFDIFPCDFPDAAAVSFLEPFLTNRDAYCKLEAAWLATEGNISELSPAVSRAFQAEEYCCHKIWLAGCAARFGDADAVEFLREVAAGNVEEVQGRLIASGTLMQADEVRYFGWDIVDRCDGLLIVEDPRKPCSVQDIIALAAGLLARVNPGAGVPVLRTLLGDDRATAELLFGLASKVDGRYAVPLLREAYERGSWEQCTHGLPWNRELVVLVEAVGNHGGADALSLLTRVYRDIRAMRSNRIVACAAAGEILRQMNDA